MELSKFELLESRLKDNVIVKQEYIEKMHRLHKRLFEYSSFIKDKDVGEIRINDDSVILTTKSNNIRLICDKDDYRIVPIEILNFGSYESEELKMVLQLVEEGYHVLDIGANIGWYSINIAMHDHSLKVYSFEPIPKTYMLLKKNLELNGVKNVETFNLGFSDHPGEIEFYYYKEGSCNASSALLTDRNDIEKVICKVDTIDRFTDAEHLQVDLIKCDVEGAELLIFKGGMKTIKRDLPIIFTEMLRKWSAKFNYHPNEIICMMKDVGYKCYIIRDGRLSEFDEMDEKTVETNFLFLHTLKHQDKIERYTGFTG